MSGLEMAGVVLGGFPIVLEASRAIKEQWQNWSRFQPSFRKFIIDISEQELLYQRILTDLLNKCFNEHDIVDHEEMIADTTGILWIRYAEKLHLHLGEQRAWFFHHLASVGVAVDQLQTALAVNDHGKILWLDDPGESAEYLRVRLVFCCSPVCDKILADLKEHITRLRSIVPCSDSILHGRQRTTSTKTLAHQWHDWVREYHLQSFSTLRTCWQCLCTDEHWAKLYMGIPPAQGVDLPNSMHMDFVLLQSVAPYPVTLSRTSSSPATGPKTTRITQTFFQTDKLFEIYQKADVAPSLNQRCRTTLQQTITSRPTSNGRMKRRVPVETKITGQHAGFGVLTQCSQAGPPHRIDQLCASLRHSADSCYGFVSDKRQTCQLLLYAAPPLPGSTHSIASIIEASSFNIQNRVLLSISLISALLQSFSTGWNSTALWTNSDMKLLEFHHDSVNVRVILSRPFGTQASLSAPLNPSTELSTLSETQTYTLVEQVAVLLLEILCNKSIETLRTSNPLYTPFSDKEVAQCTINLVDLEIKLGPGVTRGIKLCLNANLSGTTPSLPDKEFRGIIHGRLIATLQEKYDEMIKSGAY